VWLDIEAPSPVLLRGAMLTEGWTMTISMEVRKAEAFVADNVSSGQGDIGTRQALVYADPDGCLDMRGFFSEPSSLPLEPGCAAPDEEYLEFSFDPYDWAGVGENFQSRCVSASPPFTLVDDEYDASTVEDLNKQYIQVAPTSTAVNPRPVGPQSGGGRDPMIAFPTDDPAFDCYGFGADRDGVPGLVLWAEIGAFKVLDADQNGTGPSGEVLRLRNGSGFITSVTSELLDWRNISRVKASIVAPLRLFEPIVSIDSDIDPSGPFAGFDYLRRIDEGPIEGINYDTPPSNLNVARARAISAALPDVEVLVRAVIVEGTAPDFITDMNMDGRFTVSDLVAEGYTPISNVAAYYLRSLRAYDLEGAQDRCPPVDMLLAKDFDGADPNGEPEVYFCSTGSARSGRRVPR
jgi:hypothetical protein